MIIWEEWMKYFVLNPRWLLLEMNLLAILSLMNKIPGTRVLTLNWSLSLDRHCREWTSCIKNVVKKSIYQRWNKSWTANHGIYLARARRKVCSLVTKSSSTRPTPGAINLLFISYQVTHSSSIQKSLMLHAGCQSITRVAPLAIFVYLVFQRVRSCPIDMVVDVEWGSNEQLLLQSKTLWTRHPLVVMGWHESSLGR